MYSYENRFGSRDNYYYGGYYRRHNHHTFTQPGLGLPPSYYREFYNQRHYPSSSSSTCSSGAEDIDYYSSKYCTYRPAHITSAMNTGEASPGSFRKGGNDSNSNSSSTSARSSCPCANVGSTGVTERDSSFTHGCRTDGGGRMLMREWLLKQIRRADVPGLEWMCEEEGLVRIPWRHGSRSGWHEDNDALLYRRWAVHTGKYTEGKEKKPKRWKANFRCALNSLPDVKEVKEKTNKRGPQAYKVYQFQKPKQRRSQTRGRYCFTRVPEVEIPIKLEEPAANACQYEKKPDSAKKSEAQSAMASDDQWKLPPSCQLDGEGRPLLDLIEDKPRYSLDDITPYMSSLCENQSYYGKPTCARSADLISVPRPDVRMTDMTSSRSPVPHGSHRFVIKAEVTYPVLSAVAHGDGGYAASRDAGTMETDSVQSVLPPVRDEVHDGRTQAAAEVVVSVVEETSSTERLQMYSSSRQDQKMTPDQRQQHQQQPHHLQTAHSGSSSHLYPPPSSYQTHNIAEPGISKISQLHHSHTSCQYPQSTPLTIPQYQICSRPGDVGRSGSCSPGSDYSSSGSGEDLIEVSLEQIEPSRLECPMLDISTYTPREWLCHNFEPMEATASTAN